MKKTLFLALVLLILGACVTPPKPQKTQLEVRSMQTRSYETKEAKMVMKAVMHALQDDNFMIKQANVELGLLTAQKDVDLNKSPFSNTFQRAFSQDARFQNNAVTEASANISEFGEKTRVRINFQYKILDNKGVAMKIKQMDDSGFYQKFFSKVDKAVFLGKEKLQ
ncbi:hypothetical protein [Candidatus Parabeggiatoa sp. HSG14]|uniref:hypothetical protein n=1 Tax=Candidatus Parabeggiatoa sp. HSG14 TaxID=3055593 RepID=UPI0025A6B862|nr:hypothetical protein [Thiotrichales bacterium HSG14]